MRIVLVHGMGRTPLSLRRLASRLRQAGFAPRTFGYVAAFETFEHIVDRLAMVLAEDAGRPYAAIGHSLGGLLLRAAAARLPVRHRPTHVVMLGTPHVSPRLARRLSSRRFYRIVHGDAGQVLADPVRMAAIPPSVSPATVVAGTRGPTGRWSPFGSDPNDGIVSVSEVEAPGLAIVLVPALHTFLVTDRRVVQVVIERLGGTSR
jgi:pimeloyl-ACP methyl ester carboxylesterase